MSVSLEDEYVDVLKKAAVGLRLGHAALSVRSNLSLKEVKGLLNGEWEPWMLQRIAPLLNLDVDALISLAKGDWKPKPVAVPGLYALNMPFPEAGYPGASVNVFVLAAPGSREALVFDAGTQAEPILQLLNRENLKLGALFLTHTHRDHVGGYANLLASTGCARVYAPAEEPYADAETLKHGARVECGGLTVEARLTNGHSRGGMTYVVQGLEKPIAVVGDAIFAASMGGAKNAYRLALKNNREQILSLPHATVLCPGHGPMTTVGEEWAHNPFFAGQD